MGNHHAEEDVEDYERNQALKTCQHCGGLISARNPTGQCDHLYWPDNLTDEAKIANGYRQITKIEWVR